MHYLGPYLLFAIENPLFGASYSYNTTPDARD